MPPVELYNIYTHNHADSHSNRRSSFSLTGMFRVDCHQSFLISDNVRMGQRLCHEDRVHHWDRDNVPWCYRATDRRTVTRTKRVSIDCLFRLRSTIHLSAQVQKEIVFEFTKGRIKSNICICEHVNAMTSDI